MAGPDWNKIYGLDENGERLDKPQSAAKPPQEPLPPVSLEEAHDEVLTNLVNAARLPDADPKIQAQALEALYKRKYGEIDKSHTHDIRMIMSLLTEEQLAKLEGMVK